MFLIADQGRSPYNRVCTATRPFPIHLMTDGRDCIDFSTVDRPLWPCIWLYNKMPHFNYWFYFSSSIQDSVASQRILHISIMCLAATCTSIFRPAFRLSPLRRGNSPENKGIVTTRRPGATTSQYLYPFCLGDGICKARSKSPWWNSRCIFVVPLWGGGRKEREGRGRSQPARHISTRADSHFGMNHKLIKKIRKSIKGRSATRDARAVCVRAIPPSNVSHVAWALQLVGARHTLVSRSMLNPDTNPSYIDMYFPRQGMRPNL